MRRLAHPFFIMLGFVSLLLGILGIFLPLLPTTPFALLTAYFFSLGSPRLYSWVISLPKIGDSIREWNEYGVISRRAKFIAVVSILFVMVYIWFRVPIWWAQVGAYITLTSVIFFITTRPEKVVNSLGCYPKEEEKLEP